MPGANVLLLHDTSLLVRTQRALGMSQREYGSLLGISSRTVIRWQGGGGSPTVEQWKMLARLVHPRDPAIAQEIATALGLGLEGVGIVPPKPSPREALTRRDLADLVVASMAEALALPPQAARPGVLAAFDRAAAVGLSIDEVRAALRPPEPPRKRAPTGTSR